MCSLHQVLGNLDDSTLVISCDTVYLISGSYTLLDIPMAFLF